MSTGRNLRARMAAIFALTGFILLSAYTNCGRIASPVPNGIPGVSGPGLDATPIGAPGAGDDFLGSPPSDSTDTGNPPGPDHVVDPKWLENFLCRTISECGIPIVVSECQDGVLESKDIVDRLGFGGQGYRNYSELKRMVESQGTHTFYAPAVYYCQRDILRPGCNDLRLILESTEVGADPVAGRDLYQNLYLAIPQSRSCAETIKPLEPPK